MDSLSPFKSMREEVENCKGMGSTSLLSVSTLVNRWLFALLARRYKKWVKAGVNRAVPS